MRSYWKVAGVQMNCRLADKATNVAEVCRKLREAAHGGAQLIVFPECCLTGYGFESRAAVESVAEPLPGPSTELIAQECRRHQVWAVVGLFEASEDGKVYNAAALLGPDGFVASYRKIHLPCVGADRFTDPGDRPFAVHDLGGLRLGINICFDGSFPESARILTLLGADLIVLPTNWAPNARRMAELVASARAWENHVYYLAVNRVGDEAGFHYIGMSSAADYLGNLLYFAPPDVEEIFTIDVYPAEAANKRVIHCHGVYEIDRVNWRRPEMYGPLVEPLAIPFRGHYMSERQMVNVRRSAVQPAGVP
ncbi:MAG: carbon-nitrogen hydrolase family protein [Gemmataceae bacterium]|nr:carbon-nitrogen hydrolase family protein [Gemmataceae bacterium]